MSLAWIRSQVRVDTDRDALIAQCAGLHRRPHRLDTLCLSGLAAASQALEIAAVHAQDVGAIVLGTALGCMEADYTWYQQVLDRGTARANPRLFAYTLPNVVLGEVSIALQCPAEHVCISAGRASGLAALAEAAHLCHEQQRPILVLALDVAEDAAARLWPELPASVAQAMVLNPSRGGTAIHDARVGFEATGQPALPRPNDPLCSEGLHLPLVGPRTVCCASGHTATVHFEVVDAS